MQDQLISFKTAQLAKEKGLDILTRENEWDLFTMYMKDGASYEESLNNLSDCFLAVTQSLLQRWLREKYKIIVEVGYYDYDNWNYSVWNPSRFENSDPNFQTYEEALEEGLYEALKLIKQ